MSADRPTGATPGSTPASAAGRRLEAILITDVTGYSARMQRDEPGTQQLVRRDFARMRELGAQHGGEVLNTMGDGMLLCFPSAVQAVACALEIQLEFGRRRAQPPAGGALEHRIGIHIGDVVRHEGTVTGDGVNIAARLQTKAPPGGICVSQMVHDTVKGKLPMQAVFLGPEAFKNIAEPIPIYHLAAEGGATLSRPSLPVRARSPRRLGLAAAAVVAVAALGGWVWSQRSAPPGAAVAPPSAPPKADRAPVAELIAR